jgi:hypothetical protein
MWGVKQRKWFMLNRLSVFIEKPIVADVQPGGTR